MSEHTYHSILLRRRYAAPDFRAVAVVARHSKYKGHGVGVSLRIAAEERVAISGMRFNTVTYASALSL